MIGKDGRISDILEFSKHASALTSPAALMGIGGVMSQMAMQQQMDQITLEFSKTLAELNVPAEPAAEGQGATAAAAAAPPKSRSWAAGPAARSC